MVNSSYEPCQKLSKSNFSSPLCLSLSWPQLAACIYNASLTRQHFHSLSINSSFPVCCSAGIAAEGFVLAVPKQRFQPGCTGDDFQLAMLDQRPSISPRTVVLSVPLQLPSAGQAQASHCCRKLLGSDSSMGLPSQEPICTSLMPSAQLRPRAGDQDLLTTCLQSGLLQQMPSEHRLPART